MQTQTIDNVVATPWLDQFETYLWQGYREWSPLRRRPSEKTVKAALQHVRVFGLWWNARYQEPFTPDKITNFDFHAYRQWSLDKQRCAADTWNSRLWALRIFCRWVEGVNGPSFAGLMVDVDVKKRGYKPGRYRSLSDQEYGYLIHRLERRTREAVTAFEHMVAIRDWAAISVMLQVGLRVEEVSMLDIGDITIKERSGAIRVRSGKGNKERVVPLNHTARQALAAWLEIRPGSTSIAIFTGKRSDRISTRHLERIVNQVGAESRIPGLKPHDLRYTFARRLEQAGAPIEQIRDLLGHESIETTRRYLRAGLDLLQNLVEQL